MKANSLLTYYRYISQHQQLYPSECIEDPLEAQKRSFN